MLFSQQDERQSIGKDSPDGDTSSVTLVRGEWGVEGEGAYEAGTCTPCSIHNKTSDKALRVDKP